MSAVSEFYRGKNVLITGASGFLGKVILWKLIDTCEGIGKIYLLLRSKHQQSADKRLIQMLKSKPFSPKYEYTELLNKIVAIDSDLTADGLGLSQSDRTLLEDQVNVVIHSAASVKFDAPLKDNLRDNFYGTREVVKLCNSIRRLDSFVHVSTAYSNCQEPEIGEELLPLEKTLDEALAIIESYPDEVPSEVASKLLEGRPNTYTYTKAMAEHYVAQHEGKYPISIVRPSIVISSAEEPVPGWVDNVNGIAGLGCLAAIGMLRTIDWNYYATSDMVPVDYVANCIICAAVQVSTRSPDKMLIYNMTSGNMNPVSWGVFFEMLRSEAVQTPPTKIIRPMIASPKYTRANPIVFFLIRFMSELLFAHSVDTILHLIGYKRIIVKITHKMHHGYKILKPFTTNEWKFHSENVTGLSESLSDVDKKLFKFDMRAFQWTTQAKYVWAGARQFLLKEEPSEESFKIGRSKQMIVTILHYACIMLMLVGVVLVGMAIRP